MNTAVKRCEHKAPPDDKILNYFFIPDVAIQGHTVNIKNTHKNKKIGIYSLVFMWHLLYL